MLAAMQHLAQAKYIICIHTLTHLAHDCFLEDVVLAEFLVDSGDGGSELRWILDYLNPLTKRAASHLQARERNKK